MLGAICPFWKVKFRKVKNLVKQYSDLVEHIEILCNLEGNKDTKYLDEKPKNAVNWNKKSIQDIEKDYGDLINPK